MEPKIQSRSSRVTKNQKYIMSNFMKQNIKFARGQFEGADGNSQMKNKWVELQQVLHASGGATKSVQQWQKCWEDIRFCTKKRFNEQQRYHNKTGGGTREDDILAPKPLTDSEISILDVISFDAVDGDGDTPEAGVVNRTVSIVNEITYQETAGPSHGNNNTEENELQITPNHLNTPVVGPIRRRRKESQSASSRYSSAYDKANTMHRETMDQMQRNHDVNKRFA